MDELNKLAERWEKEAVGAARRAIYGTYGGGATGCGGAEKIYAMFKVADRLRAQAQRSEG